MTATLDPEVKRLAKQLHCDILGWANEFVTIFYNSDDQKSRLVSEMKALGWFVVTATEDGHDSGDKASTLDFTRGSHANAVPVSNPDSTRGNEEITIDTSAIAFTWFLLILILGILLTGLLSVRQDPWPKQLLLWCVSVGSIILLYVSIFRGYSFQKITLMADRIVLLGAGRPKGGENLPLQDIESWNHRRLQFARGYGHIVTFKMKDGRMYEIKCAAKYGPRVIAEIRKRLP